LYSGYLACSAWIFWLTYRNKSENRQVSWTEAMQGMNMSQSMQSVSTGSHSHGDDAIAHFSVASKNNFPNEDTVVTILVQDKWNREIEQFDLLHEKMMHLIIVSKDLSYFEHLHPEYKGGGRFEMTTQFPYGGYYQLIADYAAKGMGESVQSHWLHIGGPVQKSERLQPDSSLTKTTNCKQVTLSFDHLMAGMALNMNFTIIKADTKQPVSDLQPYLGSPGHAVAISSDSNQFLHVHPIDRPGSGPEATFSIVFPKSGIYKIWGQFQHHNEVFTVPFIIKVP
jgi:hypothetical protein